MKILRFGRRRVKKLITAVLKGLGYKPYASIGPKIVARAWVDPEFKAKLLANPRTAVAELVDVRSRIRRYPAHAEAELVVVENTERQHHLVVCKLCSCYPVWLLGRPPRWYNSSEYRSKATTDPRGLIREFGLEIDPEVEVKVPISNPEIRRMVIPQRPTGTEGFNEEELAKMVTRDSIIGVSRTHRPEQSQAN